MTRTRTLVGMLLFLAAAAVVAVLEFRRSASEESLGAIGDVSRLEIALRGRKASLVKRGDRWSVEAIEGATPVDRRANDGLIAHLIDLVRALRRTDNGALDPSAAGDYGMSKPEVALSFSWETGTETVLFGHRDLSEKNVFAYFPRRQLLVAVPGGALHLLEGKNLLDLRDRRITTFDADDVEDLMLSGKCANFSLMRDGDRWQWIDASTGMLPGGTETNRWLALLVSTRYDGVEEPPERAPPAGAPPNTVCTLKLQGRKSRSETLHIYQASGELWAMNTALPSRYRLPVGVLRVLIPPH